MIVRTAEIAPCAGRRDYELRLADFMRAGAVAYLVSDVLDCIPSGLLGTPGWPLPR